MFEDLLNWLRHNPWLGWFGLAAILVVGELSTVNLVFLMFAAGALAGGVTSVAVPDWWWLQILVAMVVSILTLLLLRPTLMRRVNQMPGYSGAFTRMVGKSGLATLAISATGGEVKVDGQIWSAQPYETDLVIPAGAKVEVFEVSGTTLLVHPSDPAITDVDIPELDEGPGSVSGRN